MLYSNSNNLLNKLCELKHAVAIYHSDIVCINETHFNKEISDAEISIPGFKMFRQDRDFAINAEAGNSSVSCGGGCIIYIKDNLNPTVLEWFKVPDSVAIEFDSNIGRVNIACIYRSMSLSGNQNNQMIKMVSKLSDYNGESIIVGDFNLPNVSWLSGTVNAPVSSNNRGLVIQKQFMECFHDNGLVWFITDEVTRRRVANGKLQESTLDQVLSTNEAIINEVNIVAPLGKSDHVCFDVELNLSHKDTIQNEAAKKEPRKLWGKISIQEILLKSSGIDWSFSSNVTSSEDMWNELHAKLNLVSDFVPIEKESKSMPWVNSSLKRCRKKTDKCWSIFDGDPNMANLNVALHQQGQFESKSFTCKVNFEKKITKNMKYNIKPFYAYLRGKRVLKDCVSSLQKPDGSLTKNNFETAEVLADAFASVFVKEPQGPLNRECYDIPDKRDQIDDIVITKDDVIRELRNINISKSQGPDGIHPKLLKGLEGNLNFVIAVTKLFQTCASSGKIPEQWKTANVTSIYKKGSRKDALNYRPVSLTCIICKIYEKFIRRHILNFISNKIDPSQHGFVERKSCLSNLLECVESIIELLEEGAPVDVFYFDFCKAFDSVPHYRLLTKMRNMGIDGKTLNIVEDFLSGRTFQTYVGGAFSKYRNVLSGVPQGSVLGPLLFVIFVNDLPDSIDGISKLFADDLKVIVDASDTESSSSMLEDLQDWQNLWLLKFNSSKCKVMHIPYNNNSNQDYVFNNVTLESIEAEKDLGVLTSCDLTWTQHIKSCISKANSMIAWVTRNLVVRELSVMRNVYKTMIRPHLEYCAQLWSPPAIHGNWSSIIELENVQRRFTRLIDGIGTLSYSERLQALQITTLAERRIRGDLIETFKMLNGLVEYGQGIFKKSRSGDKIISVPSNNGDKNIRKISNSYISQRVISFWNKLPTFVRNSGSVTEFKRNLEVFKNNCEEVDSGNFWEVSLMVINKIEGVNYVKNKEQQVKYLHDNPGVARRKGINIC